jgi:hypothetical protein
VTLKAEPTLYLGCKGMESRQPMLHSSGLSENERQTQKGTWVFCAFWGQSQTARCSDRIRKPHFSPHFGYGKLESLYVVSPHTDVSKPQKNVLEKQSHNEFKSKPLMSR